jgi:integrase
MSPPAVTKLRASELVGLRWDDIDWQTSTLHVRRSKGGIGTRQPLAARELRALRRLQREASGVCGLKSDISRGPRSAINSLTAPQQKASRFDARVTRLSLHAVAS